MKPKLWEVKNATQESADVYIYGDIVDYKWYEEDVTATGFKDELDALGDVSSLNIFINSYGGSVFQAQAIYSMLKRHSAAKNVYIDGLAASAASFIAMAGDTVHMPANAMMMIHNPWTIALGNAADMRKAADDLDKIGESMRATYLAKAGDKLDEQTLIDLLDAETWLTAQEAFDYGLADVLIEDIQIAASISPAILARFKNVPETLKAALAMGALDEEETIDREKLAQEALENKAKTERILQAL